MRRRLLVVAVLAAALPASAVQMIHVPGEEANLQAAIYDISNGGIIEIAAGTYPAPPGGFVAGNLHKAFTIRAASGATVILDGADTSMVFKLTNASPANGGPVVFEGLTFYRGRSLTNGMAGGVTLVEADATFIDCVFQACWCDAPSTGGGGAAVFTNSRAFFYRCRWLDNWATNEGGGLRVATESAAYLHECQFVNNRVNLPGHRSTSAGGAVHVGDADLRVTNTRFADNQAGYAGGAMMGISLFSDPVEIPGCDLVIANSTFVDNKAYPDPGVSPPTATEGGAIYTEDQTTTRIYNSRFITNRSENDGAISLYRSIGEVESSVFLGNRATATGACTGFGGALGVASNDTTADGANNRRSGQLTLRQSLVQGRYGSVTTVAQIAGCVFATGDQNRRYGLGGVTPTASAASTRASVTIDDAVLADCDVLQTAGAGGTGSGGAMEVTLTNLTITSSVIAGCDAIGVGSSPDGSGGALRPIVESVASISGSTLAGNSAQLYGGAIYSAGSETTVTGSSLVENWLIGQTQAGTAILSAPLANVYGVDMDSAGTVSSSVVSNNNGTPFYEVDYTTGPINDLQYNGNQVYRPDGSTVYQNYLVGGKTLPELNALVIYRASGRNTDKSVVDNTVPATAPVVGAIRAVPPQILPAVAAGDSGSQTESYLGCAWSGGDATLDGAPQTGSWGVRSAGVGTHTLNVAGDQFTASVTQGPQVAATFRAQPSAISQGESSTLSWSVTGGTFIDVAIDQGLSVAPTASGAEVVWPTVTTTYRLAVVTKEGGTVKEVTVWVDEPELFADGFESGNTSAWSTTLP